MQLSWFMKVLAFTAARPGAVAVSKEYKGSNEAITYEVYTTTSPKLLD